MPNKKRFLAFVCIMAVMFFLSFPCGAWADDPIDDEIPPANDEQDTFAPMNSDALIVIDLSGSMLWTPAGINMYTLTGNSCGANVAYYPESTGGINKLCKAYPYTGTIPSGFDMNTPYWSNEDCSGPFYFSQTGSYTTDCRRVEIAKRAVFNVLDDNNDGKIDKLDAESLSIRVGYMRFKTDDDTAGDYEKGNARVIVDISKFGQTTGTSYQKLYCDKENSCVITDTCGVNKLCLSKETAYGGTPLVASLKEAKTYLDAHKASDPAKDCRLKFVILISDGADTYACGGNGQECQAHSYKRRREQVAAVKALNDAGYKVFVIGFGADMPDYLLKTLNWMAYYGGTNNPAQENTGNLSAYSLPIDCATNEASCCKFWSLGETGSPGVGQLKSAASACYPSGVTSSCFEEISGTSADATYCSTEDTFKAGSNDPGYLSLNGYAFLASNAQQLTAALKSAFSEITEMSYSFTAASIQAVRTADENYIYQASFTPIDYCPFWHGHLKRYSICSADDVANEVAGCTVAGAIKTPADWDGGAVLSNTQTAAARKIYTLIENTLVEFKTDTTAITQAHLGADDADNRTMIINYFRDGEKLSDDPLKYWRLGDIFHSSPRAITSPNPMFYDRYDKSEPKAFEQFQEEYIRKSTPGDGEYRRIIMLGANDGQLHAFRAGELGQGGGEEVWSFIPPNQLRRLKLIAHTSHPTAQLRQYFVDGPTSAADIWVQKTAATDIYNTTKTIDEWKTIMVSSLGRGGITTLWSSSTGCDSGFSADYSADYNNYCGYYAFDVTDTNLNTPGFLWRIGANAGLSSSHGPYLAQPWSKMFIGRVRLTQTVGEEKISVEKWVGLIGGGYSGCGKVGGQCDTRGKGFFVIDLADGSILWSYTNADNSALEWDLLAEPVAVDHDSDGFMDTAYIGDVGGNIWRFNFCKKIQGESNDGCVVNNWSGSMLFNNESASGIRPIYTAVDVSIDYEGNLWIYAGTGDVTNPTAPNAQERIYAIRDSGRDSEVTYAIADLYNLGETSTFTDQQSETHDGWYIQLPKHEKILAEPTVYEGRVYYTSYMPTTGQGGDPCNAAGEAFVYSLDFISGKGQWDGGARSVSLGAGSGVASAVIVSVPPDGGRADLYITTSAGGDPERLPRPGDDEDEPPRGSVIFWQDRRIGN